MIKWVVSAALRFSRLVVAAAIGILGVGLYQLHNAAVDVYPEFEPPDIQIQAEALGLSAQEVEQLITVPIEQDLLNGIPWVEHIKSQSMPGLSAIDLQFEPGTDLYAARQLTQERMSQAKALPNVGTPPIMIQPSDTGIRIFQPIPVLLKLKAEASMALEQWKDRHKNNFNQWLRLLGLKFVNFWNAFRYDDLSVITTLREEGVTFPGLRFGLVAALAIYLLRRHGPRALILYFAWAYGTALAATVAVRLA